MIKKVEEALQAIDEGRIIAVKTDTVFGFLADGSSTQAIKDLYELKNRDMSKGYIVFVKDIDDIKKYAKNIPSYANKIIEAFWPGALTCIFQVKKDKADALYIPDGKSVGIRMPNEQNILDLLSKTNKTIISTSANISGEPTLHDVAQIKKTFGDKVVIWDVVNTMKTDLASTIIDCQKKDTWNILREGNIKKEALWEVLDK